MKKNIELDIKNVFNDLERKKNNFFNNYITKYVIDYTIDDDHIKVISNIGKYRIVKNTKGNLNKINQTIVKNKIAIAKKIDEYEEHSKERLIVLFVNIALVVGGGFLIPLSFFTGIFVFFLLSIFAFSVCVVTTLMSGFEYYILIKEIQNLKNITGFKMENEFKLPVVNIKGRN